MFYQPFDTKPSDFFQKEHRNNFTYPQHLHICYELIVLLDGKMTVTIDNIPYSLKKNEAVLVFPNQIHSLDSTKSEHILFLFSTRLILVFVVPPSIVMYILILSSPMHAFFFEMCEHLFRFIAVFNLTAL